MPEIRSSPRSQTSFDIILCDYYLGAVTNGQQFLEHLRNRRMIARSTLFIMITAEKNHDSVITAAECMPDDYLLKPFTADLFASRVEKLLEKKRRLARIDAMQDKGQCPRCSPNATPSSPRATAFRSTHCASRATRWLPPARPTRR